MNELLASAMESLDEEVPTPPELNEESTKPKREDEIVLYCKVTDFEGLKSATSKESHEQWEVKTKHGRVRVRKTSKEGVDPVFDLTFKTKSENAGVPGNMEQTLPIDEAFFLSFKQLAECGMVKDRYCFEVQKVTVKNDSGIQDINVPDMFYEVDMFFNEDGSYNDNAKIDLEVNKLLDKINENHKDLGEFKLLIKTTHLPFKPTDVIIGNMGTSESDKKIIQNLYNTVFLKNK